MKRKGCLLRIFVGESDRHDGRALHEWIIEEALRRGLAGATALRGMEGFGAHRRVHAARVLRLSGELPVVVEIVDTREQLEELLATLDGVLTGGMATLQDMDVHVFGATGTDEAHDGGHDA